MENPEIEELKISPELKISFKDFEVLEAKFNIITTIQQKIYDSSKYKPEEKIKIKNEKGEEEIKEIPLGNHIRWRYIEANDTLEKDSQPVTEAELEQALGIKNLASYRKLESNAKLVEWSDGSHQIIIGEEHYDIMFSSMDNVRVGLEDKEKNFTLITKPINQRMILTPSEFSQRTNEKVINQDASSQKVKVVYSFYDKQEYNKDEFSSKYGKKKTNCPLQKKDMADVRIMSKKRKRSGASM